MKNIFSLLLLFIFSFNTIAQQALPKGFAPGEKAQMPKYIEQVTQELRGDSNPPDAPVRTMAEWEELDGVVITWASFQQILSEIVKHVSLETNVYIVCSNANSVMNYLTNAGVDFSSNVFFIEDEYDSIWVRDYGPNSGYLNDVGDLVLIDWIYNRARYRDNAVPDVIGEFLGVPVHSTNAAPNDLVNTGGNFMVDGLGKGFSSDLVLDENGPQNDFGMSNHSEEAVDQIMQDYMGVDEYIKMEALPFDLIHHIDMHMKLLNENTLLVGEYPEGVADGPQIEANIQYIIENFKAAFDREFKIIRMPMPPSANGTFPDSWNADYRTYTNSLIANKTIIVPTYEEQYDTTALRIWEEVMPGYKIVGIDCNDIIPLSGALHCITKEVGTKDPLQISHVPLPDVEAADNGSYTVQAIIRHRSGIAAATLAHRYAGGPAFAEASMTLIDPDTDLWEAIIPEQELGSTVEYYISATAESGKSISRPLPAPEGYFSFIVGEMPSSNKEVQADVLVGEVFPNPASAITAIPIELKQSAFVKMELVNEMGSVVDVLLNEQTHPNKDFVFLNASKYPSGLYFINTSINNINYSQKLIIE